MVTITITALEKTLRGLSTLTGFLWVKEIFRKLRGGVTAPALQLWIENQSLCGRDQNITPQ